MSATRFFACLAGALVLSLSAARAGEAKMLVHSLDVDVHDMYMLFTVTIPEDAGIARENLDSVFAASAGERLSHDVVAFPALDAAEQARFDDAVELFERVASSVRATLNPEHSVKKYPASYALFDYSIGDGLRFLAEKTGATHILLYDAMMLVPYSDATVRRRGMRHSDLTYIYAAMVELSTGRITWFNSVHDELDLRKREDVSRLIDRLADDYPQSPYYKAVKMPEVAE